jgi:hypothetical protein
MESLLLYIFTQVGLGADWHFEESEKKKRPAIARRVRLNFMQRNLGEQRRNKGRPFF